MTIKVDTHLHTSFSTDSDTPLVNQITKAGELGLEGICVTDHMDYDFPPEEYPDSPEPEPFTFSLDDYAEAIEQCCKTSSIWVGTGVECGLQNTKSVIQKNSLLSSDTRLDYMIGSLHLLDKKDPYAASFWTGKDTKECVRSYFESLYENIQAFSSFDSLGHMDYIVRYAPADFVYVPKDYMDITEAILSFLIRKDIALEINTSGLHSSKKMQNPHVDILQQYIALGGELITIGSDAHTPDNIATHFDEVSEIMKKIGLSQYCVYKQRKPIFYDC